MQRTVIKINILQLMLLCGATFTQTSNNSITNPERSDGFGAQFQTIIYSVMYAELNNLKFIYTPFKSMEHNYNNAADFITKKESLVNFIDNFELNINNGAASISPLAFIQFFEANLVACVNSAALKKIKKVFRANKNTDDYFNRAYLNVAVHVRRHNQHDNRIAGTDTSDDVFLEVINKLRSIYGAQNPLFHVYSQGDGENFSKFNTQDIVFHLNEPIEDTFIAMVLADVLVTSASSFSYTAGILSEGIVYYMPFWHPPLPSWISLDQFLQ